MFWTFLTGWCWSKNFVPPIAPLKLQIIFSFRRKTKQRFETILSTYTWLEQYISLLQIGF